jgi:hypothetical protein
MKRLANYALLVLVVLALLWPSTAYAKEPFDVMFDDKVVFGGTYTLESGQSLDGNLVIFGGVVTTEEDSRVNGDVVLIGGVAEIGGTVNGNFVGIGGAVQLVDTALVNGDLVTIGAALSRDEGARVTGQIVDGVFGIPHDPGMPPIPDIPDIPDMPDVPDVPAMPQKPNINVSFNNPFFEMLWLFFRTFMLALLAVLVVIFFEKPTTLVSKAAVEQPVITGAAGFLTAALTPMALIALTLTIILIPVTLVTTLVLVAAWLFGWIAVGLEVGKRIAQLFNVEWAPAVSAGVGTFVLFLVLGGFGFIDCIGWIPQFLVGLWGLGAVVMTRFGTQRYPVGTSSETPTVVVDGALPEVVIPDEDGNVEAETVVAPVVEGGAEPISNDEPGSDDDSDEPATPQSGE